MKGCGHPQDWFQCYAGSHDLWVPEAFSHPAKMSPALYQRILRHLRDLGLLLPHDTVLDMMAGIGTSLLVAGAQGYSVVGVELEPKFVELAQQNVTHVSKKVGRQLPVTIIQGDARHLSEILKERGMMMKGIVSPPYEDAINSQTKGGIDFMKCAEGPRPDKLLPTASHGTQTLRYGLEQGQIGQERAESYLDAMRQVFQQAFLCCDVLAVVTKNPTRNGKLRRLDLDTISLLEEVGFKILCAHKAVLFEELEGGHMFEGTQKKVKGRLSFFKRLSYQKGSPVAQWEDIVIAVRDGGGLKGITSPPYSTGEGLGHTESQPSATEKYAGTRYGQTPGQIGNLKRKAPGSEGGH